MRRLFRSPIFWAAISFLAIIGQISDTTADNIGEFFSLLFTLAVLWGIWFWRRKRWQKANTVTCQTTTQSYQRGDYDRGDDLSQIITLSPLTARNRYDRLKDYTVVDLETTGLDPKTEAIIEVAAVRFRDFKPVDSFSTLVNPGCHIPSRATKIHGITDAMVVGKPIFAQVLPDLVAFVGTDTIVGHNLKFDMGFLAANGFNVHNRKYFDTLKLARQLFKYGVDVENHKLGTLCQHYNIPLTNAHRSEADCTATGYLFECLAAEITGGN